MKTQQIKKRLKQNPYIKHLVLNFIMHPVKTRPQWWIRMFQFAYLKRGKGSVIYHSVRKDLVPFNRFVLGNYSIVEDFSCINNAVGDLIIGNNSRIGLGNTIIGPVKIGNEVNIAQNVVISGLNHNFLDPDKTIASQGVSTLSILIEDDAWIGANSVILAGTKIGKHSVIAAGSIVTRSVPPFSVVAGNPAKIIKQYDFEKKEWINLKS
ncbi:acyltransferase [uncultured Bacteroides sp.]|uniref:acyltransferase n=1 Tax=uncultured Bacteroides sp. TaxID=162156 RepID=UPI002AABA144|nr:acyltransferase [uncultured Bacteroides sp.]